MSVCRFWWDGSQVYVYKGSQGWECCGCRLSSRWSHGEDEIVDHLREHVEAGHIVPTHAFEAFDAEHPSPETADAARKEWRAAHPQYAWLWNDEEESEVSDDHRGQG